MKIALLISHLEHAGPVNALHEILKGMLQEGLCSSRDLCVITLWPERSGSRLADFQRLGLDVRSVPVHPRNILPGVLALRRLLAELKPDICHSYNVKADSLLVVASWGLGFRRVSTVNNIPAEDLRFLYPGLRGACATWLHHTALKLFDPPLICCSNTVANHLRDAIGARTVTVLNPVERPRFSGDPTVARTRPRLGSTHAAGIIERKNPRTLLELFVGSPSCASVELAVFGEGPLKAKLMERHPDERIRWMGYTKRLADELRDSAGFISASLSEGMPLAPQLATALWLPLRPVGHPAAPRDRRSLEACLLVRSSLAAFVRRCRSPRFGGAHERCRRGRRARRASSRPRHCCTGLHEDLRGGGRRKACKGGQGSVIRVLASNVLIQRIRGDCAGGRPRGAVTTRGVR